MAFELPFNFGELTNEIGRELRAYEAAGNSDEADKHLRQAMVASCELLRSINFSELRSSLLEIIHANQESDDMRSILEEPSHFTYFLNEVEARILQGAHVDAETRKKILSYLADVRKLALEQLATFDVTETVNSLIYLRDEICKLKDEQITKANQKETEKNRLKFLRRIRKTLGVVVIATNGVGGILFPPASLAALGVSAILGTVATSLPDPE